VEEIGTQLMYRLEDDRVLCRFMRERRRVARSFLERDPELPLLAFGAADTHLHSLLAAAGDVAREFARRVEISIQRALGPGVPFSRVHSKPIRDQHHLGNTFFYVLDQERRHGLAPDPFADATNIPDLLGLRVTGRGTIVRVRSVLPRVRREELVALLPHGERLDRPLDPFQRLPHLAEAAAAALALPSIRGRQPERILARAAAVQAAEVPRRMIVDALKIPRRSVQRLLQMSVPPALARAVDLQTRLRSSVPVGGPASTR